MKLRGLFAPLRCAANRHDLDEHCVCRDCGTAYHSWQGCACSRCHQVQPSYQGNQHDYDGCVCRWCGHIDPRAREHNYVEGRCACPHCGNPRPGRDHSFDPDSGRCADCEKLCYHQWGSGISDEVCQVCRGQRCGLCSGGGKYAGSNGHVIVDLPDCSSCNGTGINGEGEWYIAIRVGASRTLENRWRWTAGGRIVRFKERSILTSDAVSGPYASAPEAEAAWPELEERLREACREETEDFDCGKARITGVHGLSS
jgi:hypothetical protein